MEVKNLNLNEDKLSTIKQEYTPPQVEYIPFQSKKSGISLKLGPNMRDCEQCEPSESWS